MERDLRQNKLDVEILKAQGASDEEIKAARAKVRKQSAAIDDFCEENDLPRRRARETAPINATWPDEDTYNTAEFPTQVHDQMREYYQRTNRR